MLEKTGMTSTNRNFLLAAINTLLRSACIARKLLILSVASMLWSMTGVVQASNIDSPSALESGLSGFNFVDVVVDGSDIYALATQKTGGISYTDPDGTVSYERNIFILKVDSTGNLTKSKFATLNSQQGTLSLQGNYIKAFLNYKKQNSTYAMAGMLFTLDKSSLTATSSYTLFSNSNWGWYPKISGDDVEHFSFAGYYRYKNTTNMGSVQPSAMQSEFNSYQSSHSQNIMPNSDAAVVDAIVARVAVPASSIDQLCADKWSVLSGRLTADNEVCSSAILDTDGSGNSGSYSYGQAQYNNAVSSNNNISVKMYRISWDSDRPMEVHFLGGSFGVSDSSSPAYYFYESESHWSGWVTSSAIRTYGTNEVVIKQTSKHVEAYINGTLVGTFDLSVTPPATGKVSIAFKGDPGQVSSMRLSNFVATSSTTCVSPQVLQNGQCVTPEAPSSACTGTSASLSLTTLQMCLPTLSIPTIIGSTTYNVLLNLVPGSSPIRFSILNASQTASSATPSASYISATNTVLIPTLQVPDVLGGVQNYRVELGLSMFGGALQFVLNSASPSSSTPTPTCVSPQVLQNGACVTPTPTCVAPQVLQNGQCVTPTTNSAPYISSVQVTSAPQCLNGCSGYTYQGGADVKVTFTAVDPEGSQISTKFNVYAGANKFWVGGLTDPILSASGATATSATFNTGSGNGNYGAYVGLMYACLVPTDAQGQRGDESCTSFEIPSAGSGGTTTTPGV